MIVYYLIVLSSAVPNHPWFGQDVGAFSVVKYLGMACILYGGFQLATRRTVRPYTAAPILLYALLSALALISYVRSSDVGLTTAPLLYLTDLAIMFMTVVLVDSRKRLLWTARSMLAAIDLASLYTLREYQLMGFGQNRASGYVAGDSNFFAAVVVLILPLAYQLFLLERSRWSRVFCAGSLLISVAAFLVAASRGGLVALCIAFAYMLLRSRRKIRLALVMLLLLPAFLLSPISPVRRFTHPTHGDKIAEQSRKELWAAGLQSIREHPVLGIGVGAFKRMTESRHVLQSGMSAIAHNTYIEYAAELGIPGLLVFLALMFSTHQFLRRAQANAKAVKDEFVYRVSSGIDIGLVGFLVAAFFISAEYQRPFWIAVFVAACLPNLVRSSLESGSAVNNKAVPLSPVASGTDTI